MRIPLMDGAEINAPGGDDSVEIRGIVYYRRGSTFRAFIDRDYTKTRFVLRGDAWISLKPIWDERPSLPEQL